MIRLNEVTFEAGQPVDAYGPGFFRLGETVVHGPLALFPAGQVAWAGLDDIDSVVPHLESVDVILMGMGAEIAPVPEAARVKLEQFGAGAEPMATPAACRTYNVLLAEGRRVCLLALPDT